MKKKPLIIIQFLLTFVFTVLITLIIINTARFASTTHGPVCKEKRQAEIKPTVKQKKEIAAEQIITLLKALHSRMELRAGKIIRAEIMIAPIIFIPITTVTAVRTDISILYRPVFNPVACEKLSSKVTAKSRLYEKTKRSITVTDRSTLRMRSLVVRVIID